MPAKIYALKINETRKCLLAEGGTSLQISSKISSVDLLFWIYSRTRLLINTNWEVFSSGWIMLYNRIAATCITLKKLMSCIQYHFSLQYNDVSCWGTNLAGQLYPCAHCTVLWEMVEVWWLFASSDGNTGCSFEVALELDYLRLKLRLYYRPNEQHNYHL